ncbi:hypothetical protein NSTC745_06407 [Nostoc sp. DSM 114161]
MPEETLKIIETGKFLRIPSHWESPKYRLGQMVKLGRIIGVEYQLPATKRAYDLGEGWIYTVLVDDEEYETQNVKESDIEPVSLEQLQAEIERQQTLVALHQKNLAVLLKQLDEAQA